MLCFKKWVWKNEGKEGKHFSFLIEQRLKVALMVEKAVCHKWFFFLIFFLILVGCKLKVKKMK